MTQTDSIVTRLPADSIRVDTAVAPVSHSSADTVATHHTPIPKPTAPPVATPNQSTIHPATTPTHTTNPATAPAQTTAAAASVTHLATGNATLSGFRGPLLPVAQDSLNVATDSLAAKVKTFGMVLDAPEVPEVRPSNSHNMGMSFILAGLFLLFCILGLRFRNNSKYISALLHNLVEVRERSNVFDETVRETSFIVLLNLLWSCSAGIVLCALLNYTLPTDPASSFGIQALTTKPALCTAICMGLMVLYTCGMALAYLTVGTVFYDAVHAKMWLKGFSASQGLLAIVFFPLALLLLYCPQWWQELLWTALGTFLIAKFVFIWKGFRIFFTQFSSWVLFLYYLCSLEIVPLILTYWAACQLCSLL